MLIKNQKGMSSILFAMIFAMVLSLLAVGFATLVRNDQRETLDQTLGYQAQYAAETAVNQVQAALKANPALGNKPSCQDTISTTASAAIQLSSANPNVKVTCVTWTNENVNIIAGDIDESPFSTIIAPTSAYQVMKISWTSDNPNPYTTASTGLPKPIDSSKYPVLRLTFTNTASSITKQVYAVPYNSGSGSVAYPSANADDGKAFSAYCNAGQCTMYFTAMNSNADNFNSGYLAIAALGGIAKNVTISVSGSVGGSPITLAGSQYTIDATAVGQDVTKRIQARAPISTKTWRPGFAVSANTICKDVKVDGDNDTAISPDSTCVDNLILVP